MVLLLSLLSSAVAIMAIPLISEARDAAPNQSEVYIRSLTYGGSGCPSGTASCNLSDDRQSLTVIFSKFKARIPHGSSSARKNCVVSINLEFPGGFQYSVLTSDFRGYASLDNVTTGYQQSTYSFSGRELYPIKVKHDAYIQPIMISSPKNGTAVARADFQGPLLGDYEVVATAGILSYSLCGEKRPLNINTEVVISGSVDGELTVDTEDELVTHKYGFTWRRC